MYTPAQQVIKDQIQEYNEFSKKHCYNIQDRLVPLKAAEYLTVKLSELLSNEKIVEKEVIKEVIVPLKTEYIEVQVPVEVIKYEDKEVVKIVEVIKEVPVVINSVKDVYIEKPLTQQAQSILAVEKFLNDDFKIFDDCSNIIIDKISDTNDFIEKLKTPKTNNLKLKVISIVSIILNFIFITMLAM